MELFRYKDRSSEIKERLFLLCGLNDSGVKISVIKQKARKSDTKQFYYSFFFNVFTT